MVSVAKNFDAPIKLLFPRLGLLDSGKRPFSMLVSVWAGWDVEVVLA